MKNNKWLLFVGIAFVLVLSFLFGYFVTKSVVNDDEPKATALPTPTATAEIAASKEATAVEEATKEEYLIILEQGSLNVYVCQGEKKELLKTISIIPEIIPSTDVSSLTNGKKFDTKEEALEYWESFAE